MKCYKFSGFTICYDKEGKVTKPKKIREYFQANPSKTIRINLDNVWKLRQFANETNESLTNGVILYWLTGDGKYLKQHDEEKAHNKKMMSKLMSNIKVDEKQTKV